MIHPPLDVSLSPGLRALCFDVSLSPNEAVHERTISFCKPAVFGHLRSDEPSDIG